MMARERVLLPPLVIFIVGMGGIIGQILLLREFLVVAHGNELIMGIILANWLVLEAAGAFLGGRVAGKPGSSSGAIYSGLLIAYAVLLPAAIALTRPSPQLLFGLAPGEAVGLGPVFLSSLLLLTPVSAVHGSLFPLACASLAEFTGPHRSIGAAYLHETLGTLVGGAALTLILVHRFDPLYLAAGVALLHILGAAVVLSISDLIPRSAFGRAMTIGLLLILAAGAALSAGPLQEMSLGWQWPGQKVVHYDNTAHGNVVVLERAGEYTFMYDGRPVATLPVPDRAQIADYAHLVGAAHPEPDRVLVIGGGLGGLVDELLQHPIQHLRYVELDPGMLRAFERFPAEVTERELTDPRVSVHHGDARRYLQKTDRTYDLIILGFLEPETLQTNRLFTREFFAAARVNLAEDGMAALSLPGSPTQMSRQTVDLNRSLQRAAETAFAAVELIAGDHNILLAADEVPALDAETLAQRLEDRDIAEGFITHSYLQYRLDPERQQWARTALQDSDAELNEDLNPAGLHYALAHWGRMFSPQINRAIEPLRGLHPAGAAVLPLVLAGAVFLAGSVTGRGRSSSVNFAVWSTGVTGMAMDLLVLFLFQTLYGFVYQMAGLLVACFMAGIWLGGSWAMKSERFVAPGPLFHRVDAGVTAIPLVFYGCALALRALHGIIPDEFIFIALAAFAALAGSLVGAQFPLAASLLSRDAEDTGSVAGSVYAADLLGGWFGGLAVSVALFPIMGLSGAVSFLVALKLASLLLGALAQRRPAGQTIGERR